MRTVIASKQSGNEDFLAGLVAEAVLAVMPKNPANFNVDNIRVVKIMGSSLEQSKVVKGMVFGREPDGEDLDTWSHSPGSLTQGRIDKKGKESKGCRFHLSY